MQPTDNNSLTDNKPDVDQNINTQQTEITPTPSKIQVSTFQQSAIKPKKYYALLKILLISVLIIAAISVFYTIIRKPLTSSKVYFSQSSQRAESINYLKNLSTKLQPSNLQSADNYLVDFGCEGQPGTSSGLGEPTGGGPVMSCNLGLLSFFETSKNIDKNISDLASKLSTSGLNIGTVNMAPLYPPNSPISNNGLDVNGYNGNFASTSAYKGPSVRSGMVFDNSNGSYSMADFTNFFSGSNSLRLKANGYYTNNPDPNSNLYNFINKIITNTGNTNNSYGYYLIYQYYMGDKICNQINVACKSDAYPLTLPMPQKL